MYYLIIYKNMNNKALIFRKGTNCVKICKSLFYNLSVDSSVNKFFGEGMYDNFNDNISL